MRAWCEGGKEKGRCVGGSVYRFLSAPPNLRRSHGTPNAVRGGRLRSRTVLCPFCHKDRRVVGRAGYGVGESGEGGGGDTGGWHEWAVQRWCVQREEAARAGERGAGYSLRYSRAEKHASAAAGNT